MPSIAMLCSAVPVLMWIAAADARERIIPNIPLVLLLMLAVVKSCICGENILSLFFGLLAGGVPMLLLACLIEHGNGIGGGDVKLCAVMGVLLGPADVLALIVIALTALLAFQLFSRSHSGQPFAPFVLLAYDIILFLSLLGG